MLCTYTAGERIEGLTGWAWYGCVLSVPTCWPHNPPHTLYNYQLQKMIVSKYLID